jgi:hypothetical protein
MTRVSAEQTRPRFPFRIHDLFGAALPPPAQFLALLRDLRHDTPAASPRDAMALTASCAVGYLNRKLFHDWDVTGGTPREAADRYGDDDIALMLACRDAGAIPYFVFGDSHSRLYQHPGLSFDDGWLLPISVTCSGASARGLINPASNLRYGDRLRRFLGRIDPFLAEGTACFFKFGQVDLEYLYPYRWAQGGPVQWAEEDFRRYTAETIARYIGYLDAEIPRDRRDRTFVCSASLPAVSDTAWRDVCTEGLLAFMQASPAETRALQDGFAALTVPDIRLRSRLHIDFNARLKTAAEDAGFPFFDDAAPFWDEDRQTIAQIYAVAGKGRDVHMDRSALTLSIVAPLIRDRARPPEAGRPSRVAASSR